MTRSAFSPRVRPCTTRLFNAPLDDSLHLIEQMKHELRFKLGYNF